jgi:peptide/nickel transport system substrate-binding protein
VPIGSGPFVITEWAPGEHLVLERSLTSASPARLDRIIFRFVQDPVEARNMLQRGNFDLMTEVAPADWRDLERNEPRNLWAQQGYWRLQGFENNFSYLAWNNLVPLLFRRQARVAFAHVFPAKKVFHEVDLGLELPTNCPYYPGGYGCDRTQRTPNYDPAHARTVLADGGFVDSDGDGTVELDGTPLRFTFLVPTSPPRLGKIARLFQEELRKIGAEVMIETLDPEALAARIAARDFGVVGAEFSALDSEVELWPLLHSNQADGGTNLSGFSHPELDYVLDAIRWQPEAEKRHKMEQLIHRAVVETQPFLIMTTRPTLDMAKRRVHGLLPSPVWYDLRAAWLGPEGADGGR